MALRTQDDWTWDPAGPMHPVYEREAKRRRHLMSRYPHLTDSEMKELETGYLPWAYLGATYYGQAVKVVELNDYSGDRPCFVLNNPNDYTRLIPQLSTKNYPPPGPPGWQTLVPDVHFPPGPPRPASDMSRLPEPWDIGYQRQMDQSK